MGDESIDDLFEPAGTTGSGTPDDPYVMLEMPIYPENTPVLGPDEPGEGLPPIDDLVLSASYRLDGDVSGSGASDDPLVMPEMSVTPENDSGS